MEIQINVQGTNWIVRNEKIHELVAWLQRNAVDASALQERACDGGSRLLVEQDNRG